MTGKISIDTPSSAKRSSWFFAFYGFIALLCFALVPGALIFSDDIGPTFGHFNLSGAILGAATALVCTWAFLVCPRQKIYPKLFSFLFLIAGLFIGFFSVFTYLMFTWYRYDPSR